MISSEIKHLSSSSSAPEDPFGILPQIPHVICSFVVPSAFPARIPLGVSADGILPEVLYGIPMRIFVVFAQKLLLRIIQLLFLPKVSGIFFSSSFYDSS